MKCWSSLTLDEFWLSMLMLKSPNIVVGQEVDIFYSNSVEGGSKEL
jgi:hypothetical protein